jgi:hypothetical protein
VDLRRIVPVLLLLNPEKVDLLIPQCLLFPGGNQYERFIKIFNRVIADNITDFKPLGIEEGDLGCHSAQKGAITLISSGCTVSPPLASICL